MTARVPFDPGLQVERTLLAWQRTCLAVAVVNAGVLRVAAPTNSLLLAVGIVGLLSSALCWIWSALRYESITAALEQPRISPVPRVAAAVVGLTAATVACAVIGLVFMVEWAHA